MQQSFPIRHVEPLASAWQSASSSIATFDTAFRALTPIVEGVIRLPDLLILATLEGHAARLDVKSACGHRYSGRERAGVVSLVPAACERHFQLQRVSARWASLAIRSSALDAVVRSDPAHRAGFERCITNRDDPWLVATLKQLAGVLNSDGVIEPMYLDALANAVAQHLFRSSDQRNAPRTLCLPRWCINRIENYVEAHIAEPIRIADLAAVAGYSEGYFQRAFRSTTGMTPLHYINQQRVRRAVALIEGGATPLAVLAQAVGFLSPKYFARVFTDHVGMSPKHYARQCSSIVKTRKPMFNSRR